MNIDDINVFFFAQEINDSRTRQLMKMLKPDIIHRGIYEWVGTHFSDREWEGAVDAIREMQGQGSLVIGGVSALWWAPEIESGPATVDVETIAKCSTETKLGMATEINILEPQVLDQLIYKSKKHIDAGCDGIELDEFGYIMDKGMYNVDKYDYAYSKKALEYIASELKNYGKEKYGKDIFVSINAPGGGQDLPDITNAFNDGSEPVDYYIKCHPYKLVGERNDPGSYAQYDGGFNFIPFLRKAHQQVWPKRTFYLVDFGGPDCYFAPHRPEEWANWYRISSAYILACGGFPGFFKSYYNKLDALEMGIFSSVANMAKFLRENKKLWHDLKFVDIHVSVSDDKIYSCVFNNKESTIIHLVNGNYDVLNQKIVEKSNINIDIHISKSPKRIWLTTPDKTSEYRRQIVKYTYKEGVISLNVECLEIHSIIVVEFNSEYNPEYKPMEVIIPFHMPLQLPASNKLKIIAVINEGHDNSLDWYVNGVRGGNYEVGLIDEQGIYTAPSLASDEIGITINAASRVSQQASVQHSMQIIPPLSLPWTETFNNVQNFSKDWYIVNGRGDWRVEDEKDGRALRNFNITEGLGDARIQEDALYSPFIVAGDQCWVNYTYSISVKLNSKPVFCYGIKSGTGIGFVFRYQGPNNYYQYFIDGDNQIALYKVHNGKFVEVGEHTQAEFFEINEYKHICIEVNENVFKIYSEGNLVRQDEDETHRNGSIGIKPSFVDANYRCFNVNSI